MPELSVVREIGSILKSLDPSRLAVLVGAGVSIAPPSRLPGAQQFLSAFYEVCLPESCDRSLFAAAAPDLRFEGVVGVVQDRFDPALRILDLYGSGRPNISHRCLARIAQRGALIVTTNFDGLIEKAPNDGSRFTVRLRPEDFEAEEGEGPEVWHIHGALMDPLTGKDAHETITASIRDCWRSRNLFEREGSKGAALAELLDRRDLLVVGYSGADDYDIAPFLEQTASPRRIIWIQHTPEDSGPFLADGVTPLWVDLTPEGTSWYRAPCANSLAAMVADGTRSADRVCLAACDTLELLGRLAGRVDEPLPDDDSDALQRLDLADYFSAWKERHLTGSFSSHLLALLLCRVAGLGDERRRLLSECGKAMKEAANLSDRDPEAFAREIRTIFEIQALSFEEAPAEFAPWLVAAESSLSEIWTRTDQPGLRSNYLTSRGRALLRMGRLDEAIRCFRESLAVRRKEQTIPNIDAAEHDLALALFQKGLADGDFASAEAQVQRTLLAAQTAENPEGIARALLLRGRILEQQGRPAEARASYREARAAGLRSGLEGLIAATSGELGLCLWTQVSTKIAEKLFDEPRIDLEEKIRRATLMASGWTPEVAAENRPDAELAVRCLAEAFRVHDRRREAHAMVITGSNLAECLDALGERCRALLTNCAVYMAALGTDHQEALSGALERVRRGAGREIPELSLEGLDDLAAVSAVRRELVERGWLI